MNFTSCSFSNVRSSVSWPKSAESPKKLCVILTYISIGSCPIFKTVEVFVTTYNGRRRVMFSGDAGCLFSEARGWGR